MRMTVNPYRWDRVNIDLFYGRDPIRYELIDGLQSGRSFGITGGRRMGKTTLLRRVEADLTKQMKRHIDSGLLPIPVYIDGLALPSPLTSERTFSLILDRVRECVEHVGTNLYSHSPYLSGQQPLHPFAAGLAEIIRKVPAYRLQIIILLDEVELILEHEWGRSFFDNWRAMLHNEPAISPYVSAVFAGASEMIQLAYGIGSPLGNILTWRELSLLSLKDTSLLVNEPTDNRLPTGFAERVYEATGGHPFLIQYVMKFVCDRDLDDADQSLEQAIEAFHRHERDKFQRWWDKFPPLAQQLYAYLAQAGTPLPRGHLIAAFGSPNINHALDILCHTGVVSHDSGVDTYTVAGHMFPKWFKHFGVTPRTTDLVDQVDRLLKDLERKLRLLLQRHFAQKYGDDWPIKYIAKIPQRNREGVTISLLDAWCKIAGCSPEELKAEQALLFAEFGDLFMLISREWGDLKGHFRFSPDPNKDKALFDERKDCLVSVRNALRHVRGETLSTAELLKAQAFCIEMLTQISL